MSAGNPAGHKAVSGKDVVVDGMQWRTAEKSVLYADELVVLIQFGNICHPKTASGNTTRRHLDVNRFCRSHKRFSNAI